MVKTRNFLYSVYSIGYSVGFVVGPSISSNIQKPIDRQLLCWYQFQSDIILLNTHSAGVSVIFSNEQYQSIAWFNVAFGVTLLILFCFLFRGESNGTELIVMSFVSAQKTTQVRPSLDALQIFIALYQCKCISKAL